MTYQSPQPPVMPGHTTQPPQGDWTPPAPKKRGPLPWLIGAVAVLVLAVGGLTVALVSGGGGKPATGTTTPPLPQDKCGGGICQTEPVVSATTPDAAYTPTPADIKLTPKITDKQCFGSAGCSVTFRVDLEYSGIPLDSDTTWLVIYEINGVDDAPQVGNLELTGTKFTSQEEDVDTASTKSKITLKVTSVEQQ